MKINLRKYLTTLLMSSAVVLATVALVLASYYPYRTSQQPPSHAYTTDSIYFEQLRGYLGGSKVVIVDSDGVLYRVSLNTLGSFGIGVQKLGSLSELRSLDCPKLLIINLDFENTNMFDTVDDLNVLRTCSMNGSYVLLAFNDTKLAAEVWRKLFETPPPFTSNEITITRVWNNGAVDYTAEKTYFIFGRTYRAINGSYVPVDIGSSAGYRNAEDLERALSEALKALAKAITQANIDLGGQQ